MIIEQYVKKKLSTHLCIVNEELLYSGASFHIKPLTKMGI